jgi:hypothetical protein
MEDLHQKNTKLSNSLHLLQSDIARRPNEELSGQLTEEHDMAAAEPSLRGAGAALPIGGGGARESRAAVNTLMCKMDQLFHSASQDFRVKFTEMEIVGLLSRSPPVQSAPSRRCRNTRVAAA